MKITKALELLDKMWQGFPLPEGGVRWSLSIPDMPVHTPTPSGFSRPRHHMVKRRHRQQRVKVVGKNFNQEQTVRYVFATENDLRFYRRMPKHALEYMTRDYR